MEQAGSLVAPDYLRFDFKHFKAMTQEEIEQVERKVNDLISENHPVQAEEMSRDEALDSGAVALFTEKYGDVVRVVSIPGVSAELCGGTHAEHTGQLGFFKITSESSIAAGVRRIEAVTGKAATLKVQEEARLLREMAQKLNASPQDALEKLAQVLEREQELARKLETLEARLMAQKAKQLAAEAEDIQGVKVVAAEVDSDAAAMKLLADGLREELGSGIALLGSRKGGKAIFLALATADLVERVHAGKLIKQVAAVAGGGGGGRPDLAQAGGKNPEKVPEALEKGREEIEKLLRG